MEKIRFEVAKNEDRLDGKKTVTLYRNGGSISRGMDEDHARWLLLAIESGKQIAKAELASWIHGHRSFSDGE